MGADVGSTVVTGMPAKNIPAAIQDVIMDDFAIHSTKLSPLFG